jgi:hypothetical protein
MRTLLAVLMAGSLSSTAWSDKPAEKLVSIHLAVYEGDPEGSVEKGTKILLANPTLVTVAGRECAFAFTTTRAEPAASSVSPESPSVSSGSKLAMKVMFLDETSARLQVTFEENRILDVERHSRTRPTKNKASPDAVETDRTVIREQVNRIRLSEKVRLGKLTRLSTEHQLGKPVFLELTVTAVDRE